MPNLLYWSRASGGTAQEACRLATQELEISCGDTSLPSLKTITDVPQCAHALAVADRVCCGSPPVKGPLCNLEGFDALRPFFRNADGLRVAVPVLGVVPDVDSSLLRVAPQPTMLPEGLDSDIGSLSKLEGKIDDDDDNHYKCMAIDKDNMVRIDTNVYAEGLFCCPYPDGRNQSTEKYFQEVDNHEDHIRRHVRNARADVAMCLGESEPGQTSRVLGWDVGQQRYRLRS